ncbi:conserved exported hypothetical protein [Methylocella tundrae]|uniref:17 kDa surface antigen n=1 Tax=Methylocella tundrae TaxID=227605 RepID=A0A8B6M1K0_METTU|nr:hypothetical protein [Methylocella tundrae]VTZ27661.1 conserved exported hypothetical protein [Methylocella tundrae]VTZ48897.1 conserved exported hypothetical protein [Methylocella tundrae]
MKAAQLLRKDALLASLLIGLGAAGFAGAAYARPGGCVKGAVVGGIAGHLVGHGIAGAAAGCAYGAHERHKYDRQQTGEGRSSSDQHGASQY